MPLFASFFGDGDFLDIFQLAIRLFAWISNSQSKVLRLGKRTSRKLTTEVNSVKEAVWTGRRKFELFSLTKFQHQKMFFLQEKAFFETYLVS